MEQPDDNPPPPARGRPSRDMQFADRQPWFTYAAIAACIGIFLSIQREPDQQSWEALAKYGYLSPDALRDGGIQGLFAPAFVHFDLIHLGLNMYWLWLLGSVLERSIGTIKYMIFFALACYIGSIGEFAFSDVTGVGASGVVYAIFGYLWIARSTKAEYRQVADDGTIRLLVGWLFLCIPLTWLDLLPIANAAHFGGILLGMGTAALFALRRNRTLVSVGLLMLFALPSVTLFWCPWSPSWLSTRALEEHRGGDPAKALRYYTELLEIEPDNTWAYGNRGMIYERMGDKEAAGADWDRAGTYDPR